MMTGWLRLWESFAPTTREITSVELPAGNATMTRTVLDGNSWAQSIAGASPSNKIDRTFIWRFMSASVAWPAFSSAVPVSVLEPPRFADGVLYGAPLALDSARGGQKRLYHYSERNVVFRVPLRHHHRDSVLLRG